jgi:tripartite-type tricarboxylate transporter receptor subunit TctC
MNCEKIRFLKQVFCLLAATAVVVAAAGQADAQPKYPARAIDIVVPMSPGGSTDLSARLIATYVNQKWKVPVNVINKPGGNCVPGSLEVFSSAPDGYTLLMDGSSSTYLMMAAVRNLPFKLMDRTFTGSVIGTPHIIVVPASSPVRTLKDLEAEAKKDPGSFTWTSLGGVGGQDFLIREFLDTIGVDVKKTKPILAKGGAESITLTAGRDVEGEVAGPSGCTDNGRVRLPRRGCRQLAGNLGTGQASGRRGRHMGCGDAGYAERR